jgi:hypothetical protein
MPLTLIDVIDSAVKIGLGAAISALASFKAIKANHLNEKHKEIRSHNIKTLELVAERSEKFVSTYVNYRNKLSALLRKRTTDDEFQFDAEVLEKLSDVDKELFAGLEHANIARARLGLMRAKDAQHEIGKMLKLIAAVRNPIMQEQKAPSKDAFEQFEREMSESITNLHNELASIYESIP